MSNDEVRRFTTKPSKVRIMALPKPIWNGTLVGRTMKIINAVRQMGIVLYTCIVTLLVMLCKKLRLFLMLYGTLPFASDYMITLV